MALKIDALYHWSPRLRRTSILKNGLQILSKANSIEGVAWDYICCGTDPAGAWSLSGDMQWASEEQWWDLWLITPAEKDELFFRPEWGPELREVRVCNSIPPDRIWLCGQKEQGMAVIDSSPPDGSWEDYDKRVDKMKRADLIEALKHEARLRHQADRDVLRLC